MTVQTKILSRQKIMDLLIANKERIRSYSITSLALFGSALREELRDDSDIDILIEMEEKTFDNYMDLKFFLEDLFSRKVDLVMKGTIKPRIKDIILGEAVYVEGL